MALSAYFADTLGVRVGPVMMLTVRGRKSQLPRSNPVDLFEQDGRAAVASGLVVDLPDTRSGSMLLTIVRQRDVNLIALVPD